MKQLFIHIATAFLSALYHVFKLLPTQKRIVCMSRQSDTDPVDFAMLKEHIEAHYPGYTVTILAKQMNNLPLYACHMIHQLWCMARSQAIVLDSYCILVGLLNRRISAPVIQIWHAMGNMKKFGYTALGTTEGHSESTAKLMHMHEGYDKAVVSSKYFIKDFAAGFNIPESIVEESPLPKADLLLDPAIKEAKRAAILAQFPQLSEKQNIVYCPTFRRTASENEQAAMSALLDTVNFDRFNFVYKAHPVSKQRFDDPRVLQDYPTEFDMLYIADYVISDYSTVMYEAGLMDIPVCLYTYDWDEYSGKRELNIDLFETPTVVTPDPRTIMDAIENDRFDRQAWHEFIRKNIAVPASGTCTARVAEIIFDAIR